MKKLIIIGASGHGKVIADIAVNNGYEEIFFTDYDSSIKECAGFKVVGPDSIIREKYEDLDIALGVGNANVRMKLMKEFGDLNIVTLVHPKAVISRNVEIGRGTVVMAGAVINSDVSIGAGCIINTCSSVDHDCIVGDYCHISVGSHLCGTVKLGNNVFVGAGSTIINNICIDANTVIGAGAVVTEEITGGGVPIWESLPRKRDKFNNLLRKDFLLV